MQIRGRRRGRRRRARHVPLAAGRGSRRSMPAPIGRADGRRARSTREIDDFGERFRRVLKDLGRRAHGGALVACAPRSAARRPPTRCAELTRAELLHTDRPRPLDGSRRQQPRAACSADRDHDLPPRARRRSLDAARGVRRRRARACSATSPARDVRSSDRLRSRGEGATTGAAPTPETHHANPMGAAKPDISHP